MVSGRSALREAAVKLPLASEGVKRPRRSPVQAELARSAAEPAEFPDDGLPEVAILGRSNVGKSSFINALLGRKRLAHTGGRPGRTRRLHFFRVDGACYLVDLPGFGYAAVARTERDSWRAMAESYLRGARATLRGAVLLVDARRGLQDEERRLLEWLAAEGIEVALAVTKGDKVSRAEGEAALRRLREGEAPARHRVALVSSRTRSGLGEAAAWIRDWTGVALRRPDGSPL